MDVLSYNDVYKEVGNKQIVKGVSFNVKKGEIFGIIGPNGAGKTTLMKMTVGLSSISKGNICILGEDLKGNLNVINKHVASMVDSPIGYTNLKGIDNLKIFQKAFGVTEQRLQDIIKQFGLENIVNKKVKTYSLGMKQKLSLAIVMLKDSKIIILDEPTNGLDPCSVNALWFYLRKIVKENAVSVIISSHNLEQLQKICDRVALIKNGSVHKIRNIKIANTERKSIKFTVSDVEAAIKQIKNVYEIVFEDENSFKINVFERDIPDVNRKLVQVGIEVFFIEKEENSIEDDYFQEFNERQ